jgi:hypothetical protein
MVVVIVVVAVIVTVRLHDIALVHHSVIVEDFRVDDEVDEDDEEVGNYFLLFS